MYPIVGVNPCLKLDHEQLGTKPKFWYRDGERLMLFKAEERGTGEDWAEKIACELCQMLSLPHVHYELAEEAQSRTPGVVCETCAPPPAVLLLANQLLFAIDPNYPGQAGRRYKVHEHTVDAVADALRLLQPPSAPWMAGVPDEIASALDVFTGYVMLDAWIANQDRHHENWGVLMVEKALHLAPTFDHGASLARNLTDGERRDRLTTQTQGRSVAWFARRARSAVYENVAATRPLTTVQAWRAFSSQSAAAEAAWLASLAAINDDTIKGVVKEIPTHRMSRICRDFTTALLIENRRRLLANEDE